MNDVDELKQFASVHSKLQDIPGELWDQVLARIVDDRPGTPGSWVAEWSAAGGELRARGESMAAASCYVLARFPFVDSPARRAAYDGVRETFDAWRAGAEDVERVEVAVDTPPGRLTCWARGLSASERRPLLVFTGGIVSLKEQWAQLLVLADQIGMAVLVGEMPSVGENTLPYQRESWRMYSAIIDAVATRADSDWTYVIANSFSGHLALRCATEDARIRGVVSSAAPISHFFTDRAWLRKLPRVTVDTLVHLTGCAEADLPDLLQGWALTDTELASLRIPVAYLGSTADEITPPREVERLRATVQQLTVKQFDDIHASPRHLEETRQFLLGSLMRMRSGALTA